VIVPIILLVRLVLFYKFRITIEDETLCALARISRAVELDATDGQCDH
jgi:hypothetical protein